MQDIIEQVEGSQTRLCDLESAFGQRSQIQANDTTGDAVARFDADTSLCGLLVFQENDFVGVLLRDVVTRVLSKPFHQEIFLKRPIHKLLAREADMLLELEEDMPLSQAMTEALDRRESLRFMPICVRKECGEHYLLDVHSMMQRQNVDLVHAVEVIEQQRQEVLKAQKEREKMQRALVEASREAGKVEVATGVLHNVGNVLNSVKTSTAMINRTIKQSKVEQLTKVVELLQDQEDNLGEFFSQDERGKVLPVYLANLSEVFKEEHASMNLEIQALIRSVEHIAKVVSSQQAIARGTLAIENVKLSDLAEEVLEMISASLDRHQIELVRDYDEDTVISTDRHMVMQILINLINNARQALRDHQGETRQLSLAIKSSDCDGKPGILMSVCDTGVGIEAETLKKIFTYGFTTKHDGSGFGLHNAANAAKTLGGSLTATSVGAGQGATFKLLLPKVASEPANGSEASSNESNVPVQSAAAEAA